jgi:hypothetical protein
MKYLRPSFLYLYQLGVLVTTRCTLNCKDCAALMPLYAERKRSWDADADAVLASAGKILDAVDSIVHCVISGGETFLYPEAQLCKLIESFKASRKIVMVWLITNGTVIPGEALLSCLRSPKVTVSISDYGKLSSKKSQLTELLTRNGITYDLKPQWHNGWVELGGMSCRNRTREELRTLFAKCGAATLCNPMLGDKLFPCGRAPFMNDLGFEERAELKEGGREDFVTIDGDVGVMRANIRKFMALDYIPACDYCDSLLGKRVEAAVQVE